MTEIHLNPIEGPVDAEVEVPASKSEMIRSLVAAGLATGRSHLYSASHSEDVDAMCRVLGEIGVGLTTRDDPWSVDGVDGRPHLPENPLDCGESGLTARITLALAASLDGTSVITGRGRLSERPFGGLVEVLESQGVRVEGDSLPFTVTGRGVLWGGEIPVDVSKTSQYATALMLVGPLMRNQIDLRLERLSGSFGYLRMTERVLATFGAEATQTTTGFVVANEGYQPADLVVEADASAAVYPIALAALSRGRVRIPRLRASSTHPDMKVLGLLVEQGARLDSEGSGLLFDASTTDEIVGFDLDLSDAPDGALMLAVLALTANSPSTLRGLGYLRHKESDRLTSFASEAAALGGDIRVEDNTLLITPAPLHSGTVDSHGDHRIAMAFAVLAAHGLEVTIKNPEVVNKTWPGYWKILHNLTEK